jgi:hypothetical protein
LRRRRQEVVAQRLIRPRAASCARQTARASTRRGAGRSTFTRWRAQCHIAATTTRSRRSTANSAQSCILRSANSSGQHKERRWEKHFHSVASAVPHSALSHPLRCRRETRRRVGRPAGRATERRRRAVELSDVFGLVTERRRREGDFSDPFDLAFERRLREVIARWLIRPRAASCARQTARKAESGPGTSKPC